MQPLLKGVLVSRVEWSVGALHINFASKVVVLLVVGKDGAEGERQRKEDAAEAT